MHDRASPSWVTASCTSWTRVAVVMQRRTVQSRWQDEVWAPVGVLPDRPRVTEAHLIVDEVNISQWLYPGFGVLLKRAEAQGYFHNVSTVTPYVFVLWRMEDGRAVPHYVSVSYDEASRWMDGGAQVDPVVMPHAMRDWVRDFVEQHYRPEPRKRSRPQSFLAPKDRGAA